MGNSGSRQVIARCDLGQGQKRTLLYDKEQKLYFWKAEGKVSCETPVIVKALDGINFKIKPTAIFALEDELEEWSNYVSEWIVTSGFQRIEKPPLPETTNSLKRLGAIGEQKTAALIWFRSMSVNYFAFGFAPKAISLLTIRSANDTTPFSHDIWMISLKAKSGYLAWRKRHFADNYQFKPWQ